MTEARHLPRRSVLLGGTLGLAMLVGLSLLLAWISNGYQHFQGWFSFFVLGLIAFGLLWIAWHFLRSEVLPSKLAYLLLGAALFRLALGVVWFIALPTQGYSTPAEKGGYIMADAYERDQTAYELGKSPKPLWKAFQGGYSRADQYGGLLFLSAAIYRYLAPPLHLPLLIIMVTACFSSLGVLFAWALTRRIVLASASAGASQARPALGERAAWVAACALAAYPEAALLGSSQMREAFILPLVGMAFYGLVRYSQEHTWGGLLWTLVALAMLLPFSPPIAGLVVLGLAIQSFSMSRELLGGRITHSRRLWLILAALIVLIFAGIWISWRQLAPPDVTNPLVLISYWIKKSAQMQAHWSERASGRIQALFDRTPPWSHLPILLAYGVVQPLLPATLIDITAAPIWRAINVWRAAGWTLLLIFLLYAPLRLSGKDAGRRIIRGFILVVWLVIFIASYRSGGDMWDGPRYRAMFAVLQVSLATWVWTEARRSASPGLRRTLVAVSILLLWLVPWYLMRYLHTPWPVNDELKLLGLGLSSAGLYWLWDWVGSQTQS